MTGIVIIDDGVNEELYQTGDLFCNLEITPELKIVERVGYDRYAQSHGTTCAAIIKKYSPDVAIGSIKILNNGHALREQLTTALLWCGDNAIKLVNLSLGTVDFRDFEAVRKALNYVALKGVILICACNNKSIFTYPASLSNAIGVKRSLNNSLNEGQYRYHFYPLDGADITGCPTHLIQKNDGSKRTTPACNSFAAPMIAAIAYKILRRDPSLSLEKVKQKLAQGAVNHTPKSWNANLYQRIDWAERALVFDLPCKNSLKIPYLFTVKNIVKIDCTNAGYGQFIEKILDYITENQTVLKEIDTVVVSYSKTGSLKNGTSLSTLICTLEHLGINLIFLDENNENDFGPCGENNIKIFHPSVFKAVRYSEETYIDVPVIAVYDFSGVEYLNILCELKTLFRKNGYNAVAVSHSRKGVTAGVEYISEVETVESGKSGSIGLQQINRVHCPQLILWGIDASHKKTDDTNNLNHGYAPDIKIIVSGAKERVVRMVIDTESGTVTTAFENTGARVPDQSAHLLVEKLYQQLMLYLQ